MSVDPYVKIDGDYAALIAAAVADHEQAVSAANGKLGADLAATDDPKERTAILSAFEQEIEPARDAYQAALAAANAARDQEKLAAEAAYASYYADFAQQEAVVQAQKDALALKLDAGTATPLELQEAVALALKSS